MLDLRQNLLDLKENLLDLRQFVRFEAESVVAGTEFVGSEILSAGYETEFCWISERFVGF
jgi:hypothetical protein